MRNEPAFRPLRSWVRRKEMVQGSGVYHQHEGQSESMNSYGEKI